RLDAAALPTSQSKYTFLLNDKAGIIDDLIVTRLGDQRFMVVANAGNAASDEKHLRELASGFDVTIKPLDRVFLAIQGPEAETVLTGAGVEVAGHIERATDQKRLTAGMKSKRLGRGRTAAF
ncbi:hypothetical protein AB4144_56435, partial [Rhizobiaceae sp. 2RAB30]